MNLRNVVASLILTVSEDTLTVPRWWARRRVWSGRIWDLRNRMPLGASHFFLFSQLIQ